MQNNFFARIDGVVRLLAIACGYGCLGLSFLIGYEIFARKMLGHSVQGVDEIGGYVLAVTAAVGFAYALLHRVHTRIELGLVMFSPTLQAVLNAFAAVMLAGFSAFMMLRAWGALAESLEFGSRASTPLQTPLWIPQTIWFGGVAVFALVAAAMAVHSLMLFVRDRTLVNKIYGPPSLDEEIEEHIAEAQRQLGDSDKGETK